MRTFHGLDELRAAKGERLGSSAWHTVEQSRIDGFAEVTGDDQWIHVDPERAQEGPFGATIAHGFLTLSLLPAFWGEVARIEGAGMVLNYGLNRVRFTAPVPVGSRLRGLVDLTDVVEIEGGVQLVVTVTVEREDADRPALVADWLMRYLV